MSLRDDLIEAGAAKIRDRDLLRDQGRLGSSPREQELLTRAVLDAMLDKLEEHADEWELAAWRKSGFTYRHEPADTKDFVSALRDV